MWANFRVLFVSVAVENLYDTLHAGRCLSVKIDKFAFLIEFYFGYMT